MPTPDERFDLAELLAGRPEGLRFEYKAWLDLSDDAARSKLAKHVAAMANHGGGYIAFGVDDDTRKPIGTPAPNPAHYRQDEIAGIVRRYLEPVVHVRVETVTHEGVDYPVAIVEGHRERPVIAKRDGPQRNGTPVGVRQGDLYVRVAGPASERIATSEDWARLIDRCVAARADVMGSILRQAMATSAGPRPGVGSLLRAAMDAAATDFVGQVGDLAGLVDANSRERVRLAATAHATLGYALVGEDGEPVALESLLGLAERVAGGMREVAYSGWTSFLPLTAPERAPQFGRVDIGGQPRTYLEGMRLPNLNLLPSSLDYWRLYEAGMGVSVESYAEDAARARKNEGGPYLTVALTLWSLHSLLAHARLVGQVTPGVQHVVVRTDFAGLKGRRLMTDHHGSMQCPGVVANDAFGAGVTLRWAELRDGYFDALRRVALPVFDLFPHGGHPAAEWLTRERVEREFARFETGSVRLFDD